MEATITTSRSRLKTGEILIVTEHQCSSVLVWQRGELGPNEHSGLGDLQRVGIGGGLGVVDARKIVLGFPLTFSPSSLSGCDLPPAWQYPSQFC